MIPLTSIRAIASARSDHTAIITENETVSWRDYASTVSKLVHSIAGIRQVDEIENICFISPNRIELVYMAAAAVTLKIPFIGLDYSLDQGTLKAIKKAANCSMLIASSNYCAANDINIDRLLDGEPLIDLDNVLRNATPFEQMINTGDIALNSIAPSERPFKAISFTSGTSGAPKTVMRFQSFDARRFAYFTTRYGFSAQDRHLLVVPLYHAAGNGWARLFQQLGSTLIIAPHDKPDSLARMLRTEWITTSVMTPPLLMSLVNYAEQNHIDLIPNSLRFLLVGGKHFPSQAKQQALKSLGPVIHEYYGTTETGVNTIAEPGDLLDNPETVGRTYDGNDVKILGADDKQLGPDSVGRIAIASYMNMDGYQDADINKILIDGKRYLITPETGYKNGDGYLFLMNRSDGETSLDLFEIENQINRLPCVTDVAVVAKKGSVSDVECALVIKSESEKNMPIIREKVMGLLKTHKINSCNIGVLDRIPYSPSGKVRTPQVLEALEALIATRPSSGDEKSSSPLSLYLMGAFCLIATTLAWGAMFPIAKNALVTLDAVHITLVRYGLASIILMLILWWKEGASALLPGKNALKLWAFGSLGFAGFSILAFAGLAHTEAQHGAIIMALMPLISVVMMWVMRGVKPKVFTLGTIIMALIGVVLVVTQGDLNALKGGALIPSLAILAGATCWVTYTLGSGYVKNFSVLRYTALSASLGSLSIILVAFISNTIGWTSAPSVEQLFQVRWELTYLVLIAGVMAVFSWNTGIKLIGPVNGVLFINLVPVTAFIIGYFRSHSFANSEILGAAITISALLLNNFYTRGWISMPRRSLKLTTT